MLPDFLAGSYKRYKEDTDVFTTWLAKAAQACGYSPNASKQDSPKQKQPAAPVIAPRLKVKARAAAKKAVKEDGAGQSRPDPSGTTARTARYAISTQDILKQAEAVANAAKKGLQLPAEVANVVERAIAARSRCTNWFRTITKATGGSGQDDEKHAYFTNILSTALRTLKPVTADSAESTGAAKPASVNKQGDSAIDTLHNRFNLLNVEEPSEVVDMSAAKVESVRKPTRNEKPEEDRIYELLLDFQEELIFESYCLFEDMHQIQEYIMDVWAEYRADKVDLMTATVTTNAAIDMIKHMEANITSRAPSLFPKKEAYWRFLGMLQLDQALQQGYDLDDRLAGTQSLEITALDDFLYLPTARSADAMYRQYQAKAAYPYVIMPARTGYVARPELLELPKYKQMQEEHERLVQMLMDMTFYLDVSSRYDKEDNGPQWASQRARPDNITKAAAAMKFDGEFSVWIVFACRILLDIQTTMGKDVDKAWKETTTAFDKQWDIMAFKQMPGGALGFDHGLYWATEDGDVPMKMFYLIRNTTQYPLMKMGKPAFLEESAKRGDGPKFFKPGELPAEFQAMADEAMRKRGIDPTARTPADMQATADNLDIFNYIKPAEDPLHMYTNNPLASGIALLDLRLMVEECGISFHNHHLPAFPLSHLYSILHTTGLLDVHWVEMDAFIKVHFKELFGSQVPANSLLANSRLAIKLGVSPTAFALNARKGGHQPDVLKTLKTRKTQPEKLSHNKTLELYKKEYKDDSKLARAFHLLESTMKQSALADAPSVTRTTKQKSLRQDAHLTPLEFLRQVRTHMPRVISDTSIDYITLTQQCYKILRTTKSEIKRRCSVEYQTKFSESSNEPFLVLMALGILKEAGDNETIHGLTAKGKDRERFPGAEQLEITAEVFKGFLLENGLARERHQIETASIAEG